jgi:hypothetical protein
MYICRNCVQCHRFSGIYTYVLQGPLWSWSYGSWKYSYLCNQCISPLKLWVWIPLMARYSGGQSYWWRISEYHAITIDLPQVTDRLYYIMLYRVHLAMSDWPPLYSWNVVESGARHHNLNHIFYSHMSKSCHMNGLKVCFTSLYTTTSNR